MCGRIYRRRDGTVITRDCPVGVSGTRRWLGALVATAAGLAVAMLGTLGLARGLDQADVVEEGIVDCFIEPAPHHIRLGRIALPQPNPTPKAPAPN